MAIGKASMLVTKQTAKTIQSKMTSHQTSYPYDLSDEIEIGFGGMCDDVTSNTMLSGYEFDSEVQEFLDRNFDVLTFIPDIVEKVNTVLPKQSLPSFEIIEDEEIPDDERLGITFKIQDKPYDEILKIWDNVSSKVYENLSESLSKKIAIILSG